MAACLVVATHATYDASERLDKHFKLWGQGTRGVDIFFVISGFVMIYASQKLLAVAGRLEGICTAPNRAHCSALLVGHHFEGINTPPYGHSIHLTPLR
jgi:hypothetical protein